MYVICLKGKPQTAEQIACREGGLSYSARFDKEAFHTGRTKAAAIENFLFTHGFTWPEWKKDGYTAEKVFFQWRGIAVKTARKGA